MNYCYFYYQVLYFIHIENIHFTIAIQQGASEPFNPNRSISIKIPYSHRIYTYHKRYRVLDALACSVESLLQVVPRSHVQTPEIYLSKFCNISNYTLPYFSIMLSLKALSRGTHTPLSLPSIIFLPKSFICRGSITFS